MSLDKSIERKKEKRKPFRGSKRFDRTCRNHGSCGYCENTRTFERKRKVFSAQNEIDEYYKDQPEYTSDCLDLYVDKEIFGEENT